MSRDSKTALLVFVSIVVFYVTFCFIVKARSAPSVPVEEIVEDQTSTYPW